MGIPFASEDRHESKQVLKHTGWVSTAYQNFFYMLPKSSNYPLEVHFLHFFKVKSIKNVFEAI